MNFSESVGVSGAARSGDVPRATRSISNASLVGRPHALRHAFSAVAIDISLPVLGGVLVGLSLYFRAAGILAWIGAAPTMWCLARRPVTPALAFGVFYGGCITALFGLAWIAEVSGDAVPNPSAFVTSWIAGAHLLGVVWALLFFVGKAVLTRAALPCAVMLPAFWVSAEWVRSHVTGIALGDGFPFLQLGASQLANTRVLQLADISGLSGVSLLVATCNASVCDLLWTWAVRRRVGFVRVAAAPLCMCGIILGALVYGQVRLSEPPEHMGPSVGIVSGDFEDRDAKNAAYSLRLAIEARLAAKDILQQDASKRPEFPSLLLWKETAVQNVRVPSSSMGKSRDERPGQSVRKASCSTDDMVMFAQWANASLAIGGIRKTSDIECANSLLFIDESTRECDYYDKVHLAPWREFSPPLATALGILPERRLADQLMKAGGSPRVFHVRPDATCATFICYDLFFPDEHRKSMSCDDVTFFVCAANEFEAQGTSFTSLAADTQRLRAIECRRAYVRNAGFGITAIVDHRGESVPSYTATANGTDVLIGRVPVSLRRSIFTIFGDWISRVSVAILLGGVALSLVGRHCGALRRAYPA